MSNATRRVVKPAFQGLMGGVALVVAAGAIVMIWAAATNGDVALWGLFSASAERTSLEASFGLEVSPWAWSVPLAGAVIGAVSGLSTRRSDGRGLPAAGQQ